MKSVVIVGGGAIGLFCALRLAKAGARVTLLEEQEENPSPFGPMASAAAAGMLAPMEAHPSPFEQMALESIELWKRWREGTVWSDGVRFDGGVMLPADSAGAEAFLSTAARLGRTAYPLAAGKFRDRTGFGARMEHAVFIEDEGTCDPLRMLSGLLMDLKAHGVLVDFHRDANSVAKNKVTTHEGHTYEADVVILAPGVWAIEAMKEAAPALRRVRAGKGQLVPVTLPRTLGPNLRAPDFYIAQRREDAVLGATMKMDDTSRFADPADTRGLLAAAEARLPGEVRQADRAWTGIRPMSPDGWPLIGWSGDVLIAVGHSRNGWLLAPITAEIVTAYVMEQPIPPDWAALSPDRFGNA
jgi:glycine oxidase